MTVISLSLGLLTLNYSCWVLHIHGFQSYSLKVFKRKLTQEIKEWVNDGRTFIGARSKKNYSHCHNRETEKYQKVSKLTWYLVIDFVAKIATIMYMYL